MCTFKKGMIFKMKVLILNGSPHKNGSTAYIINKIKERLNAEIDEWILYKENISPCIDCGYCNKNEGCAIKDKAQELYNDDYDILILASPVYMYNVTPPCFSLITRLNMIWRNSHFLNIEHNFHTKKGILVLVGGGNGEPKHALDMANLLFKFLNVEFDINTDYIYSLKTDTVPVQEDKNLDKLIDCATEKINEKL